MVGALLLHGTWLVAAGHPSGWDEVTHLQQAFDVGEQVRSDGLAGLGRVWMGDYPTEEREQYWPGSLLLITAAVQLLGIPPLIAARFVMSCLFLVLLACVAAGAAQLNPSAGRSAALAAVFCALVAPLSFVGFRHFTTSTGSVALASLALLSLARSEGFGKAPWSATATLAFILAAMADRGTGLLLLAPAWLLHLGIAYRSGRRSAAVGTVATLVASAATLPFHLQLAERWGEAVIIRPPGPLLQVVLDRAQYLAWWMPVVGLGVVGTLAVLAVAIGLVVNKPPALPALTWGLSGLGATALVIFGDPVHNERAVVFIPLIATLGGAALVWWRPPAVVAALIAGLAVGQAATHSIRSLAAGDDFLIERGLRESPPPELRLQDRLVMQRLETGKTVVLDLAQYREYWGAHWLYYLASTSESASTAAWPLRRNGTRYERPDAFLAEPCGFETAIVLSHTPDWTTRRAVEFGARITPLSNRPRSPTYPSPAGCVMVPSFTGGTDEQHVRPVHLPSSLA